jgi:hypothetical protein
VRPPNLIRNAGKQDEEARKKSGASNNVLADLIRANRRNYWIDAGADWIKVDLHIHRRGNCSPPGTAQVYLESNG